MLRIMIFILLASSSLSIYSDSHFIEKIYKQDSIKSLKINPKGFFAAAIYTESDLDYLDIYNLNTRKGYSLAWSSSEKEKFVNVNWTDDDTVIININNGTKNNYAVVHLEVNEQQEIIKKSSFYLSLRHGSIANYLTSTDDKVLFQHPSEGGGIDHFDLIDLGSKESFDELEKEIDLGLSNIVDYAFDKNNNVRFVKLLNQGVFSYYYKINQESTWAEVQGFSDDPDRILYALDDQERLIVKEKKNNDKLILAYYNPETLKKIDIAYEHPIYDVQGALLGKGKKLLGATVIQDGVYEQNYVDGNIEIIKTKILAKRRGNVYIIDASADFSKLLVLATRNGYHYKYYDYNVALDKLSLTTDPSKWLKGVKFSNTQTIKLPNRNGDTLEAYLTLPSNNSNLKPFPLIVMPHGGPFSVRDYRFDREAEILAANGFAVLRVNFRGSSGFGELFIESAKLGFGTVIESDIFDVLTHVLDNKPIDKNRICSVGGSYGGYSTAMLMIKHPKLFKCGVSFAGVFDLNLQINEAKRFSEYKDGLDKFFKNYIVDIDANPELQIEKSPIYHVEKIQSPLLLIHGLKDNVVDVEQSYRMQAALKKYGKDSELIELDGVAHGFENVHQIVNYYEHVLPFLQKNLN